ncbi:MAG: class I SAM-dependent methyltransferase [Hahellaceae bacterium]|nr:class I SAM-dependent methyltransferase [Hahellaceae bacterium]
MTLDYYNENADAYCQTTRHTDMASTYEVFLADLPAGAHLLDAGCGSGRDSAAFLAQGYRVTAFDGSREMATLAAHWVQQQVQDTRYFTISTRRFDEVNEVSAYDGVWASASLLHVPAAELPDALTRLWQSVKPGGRLYFSFKLGQGERSDSLGRHFTDADESQLRAWVSSLQQAGELKLWRSGDQQGREVVWVNGLVYRVIDP